MKKIFSVFVFLFAFVVSYTFGQTHESGGKKLKYPNYPPNCCHNVLGKNIVSGSGTKSAGGARAVTSSNGISSIGVSYQGIPGISNYGVKLKGTVAPSDNTFFDFGLYAGFGNFSINPYANFCFSLPFDFNVIAGSWYAGGGVTFLAGFDGNYEVMDNVSYFAGNITTGFYLWDWLNISFTYQIGGTLSGEAILDKFNYSVGYVYVFGGNPRIPFAGR